MKRTTGLKQLTKEKLSPSVLFLLLLCFAEIVAFAMILITGGDASGDLLFQNRIDSFMDYFHPMMTFERFSLKGMYETANIFYPPLAMLFYFVMYSIIPNGFIPENDFFAREHQSAVFPFLLLCVIVVAGIICVLSAIRNGTELEKKLFAFALALSAPMVFLLERGNIILPALLFTLLFLHWKDSESKVKRELALISLAIAAGLKIYPAVFGLILLIEKRKRDALRCAIYGILAFVLPFLVFGIVNPLDMIRGLVRTSISSFDEGFGYKVNFSNTFAFLCSIFHIPCPRTVLNILALILGILTFGALFLLKENWKRFCVITIFVAAMPPMSYMYVMVFMLIPAVLFVNESDKQPRSPLQYVYAVLLSMCFIPLPFTGVTYGEGFLFGPYPMTFTTFSESLALLLLAILLIREAVVRLFCIIRSHKSTRKTNAEITAK
ncbi:MAG: DUF2029 domain-containing protein [Ruminococcaceae bacterium]|nr:DUF2029 domain-containing protein [Oscillospiraceae bacterium]